MKKASEYRQHAAHCRLLARAMDGEHREQLLAMAANWDRLVEQRMDLLQRHPELSDEPSSWKPEP
ncbi:MAG: hypothetical protein JWO33_1569 [Caulobacteraceae bacterium]|nr:hypothetical protein [Caulobacteraceae bacterium]